MHWLRTQVDQYCRDEGASAKGVEANVGRIRLIHQEQTNNVFVSCTGQNDTEARGEGWGKYEIKAWFWDTT